MTVSPNGANGETGPDGDGFVELTRTRDDETGPLLEVRDLKAEFDTESGTVHALGGVDFSVSRGETLAIVGESGCGKTVTALSILQLLPRQTATITDGEVLFRGRDLLKASKREMRRVRGDNISMVFQDALTALNPVKKVGNQIVELIRAHRDVTRRQARTMAINLLELVGIPNPTERADDYVFQFSGGMRQRAMIAMAIALEPDLLIADEPTTALDVTVQAQVLELLLDLKERLDMAMILITHDLGVVAGTADRVMVMYAGQKVEEGSVSDVFHRPQHPYTWGLLQSMPRLDASDAGRLYNIEGAPPSLISPPTGCRFAPRCPYRQDRCETAPDMQAVTERAAARCHFVDLPDWGPDMSPESLARQLEGTRA